MAPRSGPVTAEKALFTFYDIESLANAFTLCAYTPRLETGRPDDLEVFFLVDDDDLDAQVDPAVIYDRITGANPGLPAVKVVLHNLRRLEANLRLAKIVGLSDAEQVCDRSQSSSHPAELRPVCDTDTEYDPTKHPFLAGYNSMNYDTVMLACYLLELRLHRDPQHETTSFERVQAAAMRKHNDALFSEEHIDFMPRYLGWDSPAALIRRAMLDSGRHLDVARLNELQSKVGLKRLLGMLGHQIKESERLSHDTSINSLTELAELLAYNVSDCLGLSQLFAHPVYRNAFDLKASLMAQYPETVRARTGAVRRDRLTVDTSSAKFVGRILAPNRALTDIKAVSFDYPAAEIAAEENIEQINVLEFCRDFFHTRIHDADARARFDQVYAYYRSIEGKNFNDSKEHTTKYGLPVEELKTVPRTANNLPYFHSDGTPGSCFATFSTGGIHGAEADHQRYLTDRIEHARQENMLLRAKALHPDPRDLVAAIRDQHNALLLPDGSSVDKRLVLLGSEPKKVKYRQPKKGDPDQNEQLARAQAQVECPAELLSAQRPPEESLQLHLPDGSLIDGQLVLGTNKSATSATYRDEPIRKDPVLFPEQTKDFQAGSTKLHPRYARTSAGHVIHEDFTSYYPNLLRRMRAFYNPDLGEDRYAQIFFDKERYGQMMKQPDISASEKERLATLREGTKLILNSASGAGDAAHANPIRMNNRIISMRIIGQLFTWLVAQAQTLAGARIISTNTDGLYSIVGGENGFDAQENNRVLAEQQEIIGVAIEPEPMFLISKDSNNRMELVPGSTRLEGAPLTEWQVSNASGASLACHEGPSPRKALAHPAVMDFAMTRYLQTVTAEGESALTREFDPVLGRKILHEAIDHEDPVGTLTFFQNVIAASRGSITYPFALDPIDSPEAEPDLSTARALQMINRVLIVRPGTPDAVNLRNAGAWKVTPESQQRRRANGEAGVRRDATALRVLRHHGWVGTTSQARAGEGLNVLPTDQDVVVRKISSIDPTWPMLLVNDDLHTLPQQRTAELIAALDLEVYLEMLQESFTKNWRNHS